MVVPGHGLKHFGWRNNDGRCIESCWEMRQYRIAGAGAHGDTECRSRSLVEQPNLVLVDLYTCPLTGTPSLEANVLTTTLGLDAWTKADRSAKSDPCIDDSRSCLANYS